MKENIDLTADLSRSGKGIREHPQLVLWQVNLQHWN
jgi:hypothetical protein